MSQREVPCETCGVPTPYEATKRCTNCWEVEWRLPLYMQSEEGRHLVRKALAVVDEPDGRKV